MMEIDALTQMLQVLISLMNMLLLGVAVAAVGSVGALVLSALALWRTRREDFEFDLTSTDQSPFSGRGARRE